MKEYNKIEQTENPRELEEQNLGSNQKILEHEQRQIVSAKPVKKGAFSRLGNALFGEHGVRSIGAYVGKEIVVPALKGIIVDSFVTGITSAVYGDDRPHTNNYSSRNRGGYTNYSNRYQPNRTQNYSYQPSVRASNRVGEYEIADRNSAMDVLASLQEIAEKYGSVTVADYYDFIGITTEYTDNNYGWTAEDMARVHILATRGGYILNLPKARSLG